MIILRTKSQLNSFLKRNKNKAYNYREGCGCCGSYGSLSFDTKTNKVIFFRVHESSGEITATCDVLAVYKHRGN